MSLKVAKQESNYEPIPEGTHRARLVKIIDVGTQVMSFSANEEKHLRRLRLTFETPDERATFKKEDGEQPYMVSKEYTMSLHDKSSLRPAIQALLGRNLKKEEEKEGFDLSSLLGAPCMITVEHKEKEDKKFPNITGVSGVPKGMEVPEAETPFETFDVDNWNEETFRGFNEYLQDKIMNSLEAREEREQDEKQDEKLDADQIEQSFNSKAKKK